MYTESLELFAALVAFGAPAEVPPPPPVVAAPVVADHGVGDGGLEVGPGGHYDADTNTVYLPDGSTEIGIPQPVEDVIHEDDPRWDCRTMGNRRCGTTGPNGERWWYEYDEEGRTIIDEGPVNIPGPPPVPDELPVIEDGAGQLFVPTAGLEAEIAVCHVGDPANHVRGIGVNSASLDDVVARGDFLGCDFHQ